MRPAGRPRRTQALAIAATVLAVAAAVACSPQEEPNMASTASPQTSIPALDAAIPAHVETATFALG